MKENIHKLREAQERWRERRPAPTCYPLRVKEWDGADPISALLVSLLQPWLKDVPQWRRVVEGQLQDILRQAGFQAVKRPGCPVSFPAHIVEQRGRMGGNIDIHAERAGKRIGIEVEESGWHGAFTPELLKLGWSDLDYRLVAWDVRRQYPIEKLPRLRMLPFPNAITVVTRFGAVEVSSECPGC